jgi:lysophospholipase L1-like esterase
MRMRRALVALTAGVGVALAVATAAAATDATGTDATSAAAPAPQPAAYLALGDSVAVGVGATNPDNGYVALLHDTLEAARPCADTGALGCRIDLDNIAVSGATTTTLISGQLPGAVALLTDRRQTATPLDDVRLVTLDIGGNDVFTPVITACAGGVSATCTATIAAELGQVADHYDTILSALRAAAGPDTTIAVMTYYNPLPGCPLAALSPLADLVLEGGGPVPAGLNDIIRASAARYGAVVAETGSLIGASDLVGDCLHPDDSGHAKIAGAFADAIDVAAVAAPPGIS